MRLLLCFPAAVLLLSRPVPVVAQTQTAELRVLVRHAGEPVEDAAIRLGADAHRTDAAGEALIAVPAGRVELVIEKEPLLPERVAVEVAAGARRELTVDLQRAPAVEEHVTVVATTRTERRLDDQPVRVEVLGREEIEEKMLMTPGDIVMLLNEMGGLRVQATSPSLGAASVRIQGMRGRYTRVLSDGLPIHGDTGGLGLLQIPPMDLARVEVIKGVASAMYGAGATGGVVNLISRRPGARPAQELLLNQSSLGASDAVAFLSAPFRSGWSASLLAGGHWQRRQDTDDDGWSDVPRYARGTVRPRVFWDGGDGRELFATAGFTGENRQGGGLAGGAPFAEALDTARYDAALSARSPAGSYLVTARAAVAGQRHDHRFGGRRERDRHSTAFGEIAVRGTAPGRTWVAGAAIEREAYDPLDVARLAYAFLVPGVFAQYDADVSPAFSLSASGRLDVHSEYGTFFSPRLSALLRRGPWSSRASVGGGFFAPTPLTEETEAAGLTELIVDEALEAERTLSASVDLSWAGGPLSSTVTVFASRVRHPVYVERETSYRLRNLSTPATTAGMELLALVRREPWALTASYTYVRAVESVDGVREDVPLTPRHSAGLVGMWEAEDTGRVGIEWYYTGRQRLEANPFRSTSRAYMVVGVLAERRLGRYRVFVNGENLTGVRQTRWDPLLRPARGADGRWTVDAWAPLDGRAVNAGVRLVLGED